MPNWLEGVVKFRGKYNDLKNFLEKELIEVDMDFTQNPPVSIISNQVTTDEYGDIQGISNSNTWFKTFRRAYIDEMWSCSIYEDDGNSDSDKIFCANVKSAWDLTIDEVLEVANLYHIDVKGHMFESGMCFERDFEVDRNGNIIKNLDIKHDDYDWDSINPLIGG